MSYSPSYSPVLDILNLQNLQNAAEDSNPVTNPFYYAQDRDRWYLEEETKACAASRQKKTEMPRSKKRKSKFSKNSSFIIRKEQGPARRLIKIMIYEVDGSSMEDIDAETSNATVNVQYIVTNNYDDVMDETDNLVSRIVKKLSKSNV